MDRGYADFREIKALARDTCANFLIIRFGYALLHGGPGLIGPGPSAIFLQDRSGGTVVNEQKV